MAQNKLLHLFKGTSWLSIISNAWFIGLFPAILIILLLPDLMHKFTCELVNNIDRKESRTLNFFEDLNGDHQLENLTIYNFHDFAACLVKDENGKVKRQVNFEGLLPAMYRIQPTPIYLDINSDGFKEIFIFTQIDDSLFLNAFDYKTSKLVLDKRFITKIGMDNGKLDYSLYHILNFDKNKDGVKELYFNIHGGYSLYPRKMFCYDFVNDSIITSPDTGVKHLIDPFIIGDSTLIFWATGLSTDNCKQDFPYPYPDSCCWIMALDKELKYFFDPIPIGTIGSTMLGTVKHNEKFHFNEISPDKNNRIFTFDLKGNYSIIDLNYPGVFSKITSINSKGKTHYFSYSSKNNFYQVYEYIPNAKNFVQTKLSNKIPFAAHKPVKLYTLKTEMLFGVNVHNNKNELITQNLKHTIHIPDEVEIDPGNNYIQSEPIEQGDLIYLCNNNNLDILLIQLNKLYPFRFLFYLLIYLASAGFIWLTQYLQKQQQSKRLKLQKQIETLQLQLVNSQLDPHFTFNSMNTISSKILKGEKFEAYDLMTSFSRMMRSAMLFSSKDHWSLKDELNFTKDYMTLMQQRFSNLFKFKILVEDEINIENIKSPRLLIQNFSENAIKHAFNDIDYLGNVLIKIKTIDNRVSVEILDNGIGIRQGKLNTEVSSKKSGKGIGLIQQQIQIFNKLYKSKLEITITDNPLSNDYCGTMVVISNFN